MTLVTNAHEQIVELLDVVPDGSSVALVLEFVPCDLFTVRFFIMEKGFFMME